MKKQTILISAGVVIGAVLLVSTLSNKFIASEVVFSTRLYPKFQAKACTQCHDFFLQKLNGLSFNSHIERTAEKCVECHKQEVTGFATADEWFAQPGLYTSDMNAQQTCETIMNGMQAQFKHKDKLARDLAKHLFESPRVLWGIAGATPNSGRLPEKKMELGLVQGGMEEWKAEVNAWIQGGMKCQ